MRNMFEVREKVPVLINAIIVMIMMSCYHLVIANDYVSTVFSYMQLGIAIGAILLFLCCLCMSSINSNVAESIGFVIPVIIADMAFDDYIYVEGIIFIFMMTPAVLIAKKCLLRFFPIVVGVHYMYQLFWGKEVPAGYTRLEHTYLCGYILLIIIISAVVLWVYSYIGKLSEYGMSLAYKDSLTDCYNKNYWLGIVNKKVSISKELDRLIFIDVCKFKSINDEFGHVAGDLALKCVADTIKKVVNGKDSILIRVGGDEFIVLCSTMSVKDIELYLQKSSGSIGEHNIKLDIGISDYIVCDHFSYEDAYMDADNRMYLNKKLNNRKSELEV